MLAGMDQSLDILIFLVQWARLDLLDHKEFNEYHECDHEQHEQHEQHDHSDHKGFNDHKEILEQHDDFHH